MKQSKHLYNILFISHDELFTSKMKSLVPTENFNLKVSVSNLQKTKEVLAKAAFDIAVLKYDTNCDINPLIETFNRYSTELMIITEEKYYRELYETCTHSGAALLKNSAVDLFFADSLQLLCAARERTGSIEKRAASAENKVEEMKIINRAKWLLVAQLKMTEPQAHKFIEKQAMNRCVTKRTIAENILSTYK